MARETTQSIQPVAFHLIEAGLDHPLVAMRFPDEWRAPLQQLAMLSSERGSERPSSFRIQSLNAAIAAFTPQLFVSPGQAYRSDDPWLIATEEIRPDKILRIVRAWLAEHYSARSELAEAYDTAFEAIRDEDLVWEPFQLSPNQEPSENNTARVDSLGYAALPAFVANALVKRDVRIQVGPQECRLVRVPVAQDRAELQTWPPVYVESENGRRGAYSYVIGISLQTLAGVPRPRIHLTYGVRRWRLDPLRTPDRLFLPGKEGRTVYLRHPQALTGVPQSSHFTRAVIDGVFVGENQRVPVWRDARGGDSQPDWCCAARTGGSDADARAVPDPSAGGCGRRGDRGEDAAQPPRRSGHGAGSARGDHEHDYWSARRPARVSSAADPLHRDGHAAAKPANAGAGSPRDPGGGAAAGIARLDRPGRSSRNLVPEPSLSRPACREPSRDADGRPPRPDGGRRDGGAYTANTGDAA
ncbi:DUF3962 domain-containing protein [Candidatus Gracilibacteria bacterium]|nr:DUF3962 domain-containing protein [Candidatus Gracilibacteria bacterium]